MKRNKGDLLSNTKDVKNSKFVANNTLEIEYNDGSKAIRLHDTDVVTFKDGKVILNSGGWKTPTTKDRINRFSPVIVSQQNHIWYVKGNIFYDGITFDLFGNQLSKKIADKTKKVNKLRKQIKGFVNLLSEDNLPTPSSGDFWFCHLKNKDGKTIGDLSGDNEHLLSHLEEKYLHGSLLVNAMLEAGYAKQQIAFHYQMKFVDTFKRALTRYLQKRLISNIY